MVGTWDVKVSVDSMPQKIATACGQLNEMVGAVYAPIAYLGSQLVNGTNHAVLAEQDIVAGKDVKNIVLLVFRETKEGVTLANIERVAESGGELGGVAIDVKTAIPSEAKRAFNDVFNGFVGSKVAPFALLGTQMAKGMNYIFAAEITPVVENPQKTVALVTVNALTKDVAFVDLLTSKQDVTSLGYAFTWLRRQNTSLGKSLDEWQ